jgi:sulfatase modifying factor 1
MKTILLSITLAVLCFARFASADIAYQFVIVGDPGNPNDTADGDDSTPGVQNFGSVGYSYQIGKYEVTIAQYTEFLNAVADTDPNGLYHTSLGTNMTVAGIARSGTPGFYSYSVIGDGNRPVTYVGFQGAMRFANWVHNGQPIGAQNASTTEDGAYTLTPLGLALRKAGARVWIPSENEWYKAAYYDPTIPGSNKYWLYPTRSDTTPNSRNGSTTDTNSGNFFREDSIANGFNGGYAVTNSTAVNVSQNYLTPVGAFTQASSYYGTFDQGGNVSEYNEAIISGYYRGLRGGSEFDGYGELLSSSRHYADALIGPVYSDNRQGFRLASIVFDTDGDGIPDLFETNTGIYVSPRDTGTSRTNPDSDGDGISDGQEVNIYHTNPHVADANSDGDGVPDQFETGTGIYVSPTNTGTSPTAPDSDGDGLTDGQEVNTYHSNPNLADTDGDGFSDPFEISTGFDPASATSTPDILSSIRTAVEYRFNAANGVSYRIEASTDLANWTTIETPIIGTGGVITRFYSIEGQLKRFFRSRRN